MSTFSMIDGWTNQQIFDHVARHLLTQGERSSGDGICLYRGPRGLKCAAGCCIADKDYSPEIEQMSASSSELWDGTENPSFSHQKIRLAELRPIKMLMSDLQIVHDFDVPETWPRSLMLCADNHKLNPDVLQDFPQ